MAISKGNTKNIPICLSSALLIILSSAPSFLSIIYLSLLSLDSDNSFNAITAVELIMNIIPRYNPRKVTNALIPVPDSAMSILELIVILLVFIQIFLSIAFNSSSIFLFPSFEPML